MFTIVDSVVLRPLPYANPDELVTLWDTNPEKGLAHDPISPVNFMDYRALPVFTDAAGWWVPGVNLVDPGSDPMRVNTIEVSGNLFEVLGVKPQVGAGFPEGGPFFVTNELICVISDRLWRTRYSGDPSIIGKQLSLNDTPYTVVGVMPAKMHYPDDVDIWQRVRWDYTQHSRAAHFMEAVARLKPGTTFEQAQSAVQTLGLRLEQENQRTNKGWGSRLIPLLDEELGYYRPALMVLFGAVGVAARHRRPERGHAAAHARAVAGERDCRARGAWRGAATADHAVDGREPRACRWPAPRSACSLRSSPSR